MLDRDDMLQFDLDARGRVCVTGAGATLVRAGRRHPITASPLVVLPDDAVERKGIRLRLVLEPWRAPVRTPHGSHRAAITLAGLLGMTSPAWAAEPASPRPPAAAVGAIQGKVGRAEIELEISDRTVLMDPGTLRERAATTDDKGRFSFADVKPGTHVMRVRVGEREKAADAKVTVQAGKTASAWLQLRRNVTVLRVRRHAGLGSPRQPHSSY